MVTNREMHGDDYFVGELKKIDQKFQEECPFIATDTPVYQTDYLPHEIKEPYDNYRNQFSGKETKQGGGAITLINGFTNTKKYLITLEDPFESTLRHEDNHVYLGKKLNRAGYYSNSNPFIEEGIGIALDEFDEQSKSSEEVCKDKHAIRMEEYEKVFGTGNIGPLERAIEISKKGIKKYGLQVTTLLARDAMIETRENNFNRPDLDVYEDKINNYENIFKMIS